MDKRFQVGAEVEVKKGFKFGGQRGTVKQVLVYTPHQTRFHVEVVLDSGKEIVMLNEELNLL